MIRAFALLLVAVLPAYTAAGPENNNAWESAVQSSVQEVAFHGVVLIEKDYNVVLNEAVSTSDFPVTSETRYWIASISKSFTAVLIFRLRDEGVLSLQDRLSKFFPDAPADKRNITIAQLLSHTSGLPNKYASEGISDRTEAAKRILALPLGQPPGKSFDYTNDGYSLLGIIASIAAHADYGDLIARKIFTPAGMTSSGLWPTCNGSKPVLSLPVKLPSKHLRANWGYKGPDGICSTASDLAMFMDALRQAKVLQPNTVQAMWAPVASVSIGFATSGWFRGTTPTGTEVIITRGTDHGHNSIIKYYPKKDLIFIALSSSKDPDGPLLARQLLDKLEMHLGL
jgi:CubicO group peptidase (beta-lactamase class C family)